MSTDNFRLIIYSLALQILLIPAFLQAQNQESDLLQQIKEEYTSVRRFSIDSMQNYLEEKKEITQKANDLAGTRFIAVELADIYKFNQDSSGLSEILTICLEISEQLKIDTAACHYIRGQYLFNQRKYENAEFIFKDLIPITSKAEDTLLLISVYTNLGTLAKLDDRKDESSKYFIKALKYANDIGDTKILTSLSYDLCSLFCNIGDYERGQYYLEKAKTYVDSTDYYSSLKFDMRQADIYSKQKNYKAAEETIEYVMKKSKEKGLFSLFTHASYVYTSIRNKQGNYEGLATIMREAIKNTTSPRQLYHFNLELAQVLHRQGNCQEAEDAMLAAKKKSSAEKRILYKPFYYQMLIRIESCLGKQDSINKYVSQLMTFKDSIYQNRSLRETKEIEAEFQSQIKEDSIALLSLNNQNQEVQLKSKNTLLLGSGLFLLLLGFVSILLRNRNKAQKELNALLKENDAQKSKLFSNIAHELQTPLTLIGGFSKKMQQLILKDPKSALEMNTLVRKNTRILSETTQQILSLSKLDIVETKANNSFLKLSELLNYVKEDIQPIAKEKSIELDFKLIHQENLIVYTDPERLTVVIKNLLTNAVKFAEKDTNITLIYQEVENQHQISIHNIGRGITTDDLPNIFNRFYQSKNEKPEGGFGIGLAICKEYMQLLGGTISAKSDSEEGTTFWIQFPKSTKTVTGEKLYEFPVTEMLPTDSFLSRNISSNNANAEILIVEDNVDVRSYLKMVLGDYYNINFAKDGALALQYLDKHLPKLIITDWMMPNVDGLDLVKSIKSNENLRHIPILMLTARSLPTDQLKALRAGVDDYLLKPFEEDTLKKQIDFLLDKQAPDIFLFKENGDGNHGDRTFKEKENQDWLIEVEKKLYPLLPDFDLNTEKIATVLEVSPSSINSKIRELTGLSLVKYIRELRFWEARRMLETNEYNSVKAVSLSVGFKHTKYFSRKFKERFGKYPSEYLNK